MAGKSDEEVAYENYCRKKALLGYYMWSKDGISERAARLTIDGYDRVYPHFPQRYKDEGHE